jgi:hypothetical protein
MRKTLKLPDPLTVGSFLCAYIFFYTLSMPLFGSNDAPWHIAAGNFILENGYIPKIDPWSHTAGDYTWYNISWLWDVIIASVAKISLEAVFYFSIFLYALLVSVVSYTLVNHFNVKKEAAFLAICIVILTLSSFVNARPQIITFFFVFFFFVGLSKRNFSNLFYIFPPLMALWVNLHGGFLAGFILIGAYGLEAFIERNKGACIECTILLALCTGAMFISPYGIYILEALYRTLGSAITAHIIEWQPFYITNLLGGSVFFIAFILSGHFSKVTLKKAEIILVFFWFFMGMFSVRHLALSALIGSLYLAKNFETIGKLQPLPKAPFSKPKLMMPLLALSVIIILPLTPIREKHVVADEDKTPTKALEYLQANHSNAKLLND